jgi:hypothetical protein
MDRQQLDRLSPLSLMMGTVLFSLLSSLTVYLVNRRLQRDRSSVGESAGGDGGPVGTASVPVVSTVDPDVPRTASHFTEATILPGFTETGTQVEHDDDVDGRSPGGV